MPRIATISNEIFFKLLEHERRLLQAKFADPLMLKFLTSQEDAIKNQIAELDPDTVKTPEEFMQAAKDLRLTLQFWTDFRHLAEDWGKL
jgi:hypothetical protein